MEKYLPYVIIGLVAYLIGSVPFGFLIGKAHGIDIRTVGSKNIGATNVFRTVGKGPGLLAFLLDFLKGLVSAWLVPVLYHAVSGGDATLGENLTGGILAVVGHTWPVFLHFKGGKGVATSAGMLFAVAPAAIGIALGTWVVVMAIGRYVSLASILASLALGVTVWIPAVFSNPNSSLELTVRIILTVLALLVIVRHHANIGRLINGTENRFSFTKKQRERAKSGK